MTTEHTNLIEHLESGFGRIESGWTGSESSDSAIQVVEFRGDRVPAVTVLSTLGLSSFAMRSPVSQKLIRQELFIMTKKDQFDPRLPAILDQVARERARTDAPVLRGDVITKENPVLPNRDFIGLYATLPIYYPRSFWSFRDDELGDVVLCWLLPIRRVEQMYITRNGWSAFENLMDQANWDLFDLERPTLQDSGR